MHSLHTIDYLILGLYTLMALYVGYKFKNRASSSTTEFFLAGRSLPWSWVAISMAATTFAADTPLAITEIIRSGGLWDNWQWWCWGVGWVAASVWIAPLWRRSEVVTDAEFISLRYDRAGHILRPLTAVYFGVILNVIIMGWVIGAMSTILTVVTGWPLLTSSFVLMSLALLYSASAGLWGVVITDLVQFVLAVIGTTWFALVAVDDLPIDFSGAIDVISKNKPGQLDLLPPADMFLWGFVFFVGVQSWAWYQSSLNIYFVQRLGATHKPSGASKAALLFNIINFSLRHWPWVVIAVCSIYLWPTEQHIGVELAARNIQLDPALYNQAAYPLMMLSLPPGLLGLVLLSLLAAFMSTIDTHLNWGASYLVRDIAEVRLRKHQAAGNEAAAATEEKLQKQLVSISRYSMVLLFGLALGVASLGNSVTSLWHVLFGLTGGLGFVYWMRWFWMRLNGWAEVGCIIWGLVSSTVFILFPELTEEMARYFEVSASSHLALKLSVMALGAVVITLLSGWLATPPSNEKITAFRQRLKLDHRPHNGALLILTLAALVTVYGLLTGIYLLMFTGQTAAGLATTALAALALLYYMKKSEREV